jgi:hypothetical protein
LQHKRLNHWCFHWQQVGKHGQHSGWQVGSQTGSQCGTMRQVWYLTQYCSMRQVVTGTCRVQVSGTIRQVVYGRQVLWYSVTYRVRWH